MQDAIAYHARRAVCGTPAGTRRSPDTVRRIPERYVCIATQSTAQCKYWNNPRGWPTLIAHLKTSATVCCALTGHSEYGQREHMNTMPEGCEDFTGDRPLQERVSLLLHADFFIGLGSGLSWLAWAAGTPVVMISGFSHPSDRIQHALSRDQFPRVQ